MTACGLDPALLATPVTGVNLSGSTLGEVIGRRAVLLVFLRHFGCLFCRETVKDLRHQARTDPSFPRVVFVYQGTPEDGASFFGHDRLWPDAEAVADLPKHLYDAFGVERGGVREMFGARSFACGLRAAVKGNGIGRKVGDGWTLPTVVALRDGQVRWRHHGEHAGDHPRWSDVPDLAGFARRGPGEPA